MQKIYTMIEGDGPFGLEAVAVSVVDGKIKFLADHACSSVEWAKHDLGIGSDLKHEIYNEEFGEGKWEIEWVDEPEKHPVISRFLDKAHESQ